MVHSIGHPSVLLKISYLICEYHQAHDHHRFNHRGDRSSLLVLFPGLSDECLVPDFRGAGESCDEDKGEPDWCGEQDVQEGADDRGSERPQDLVVRPIHCSRLRSQFAPDPTHHHRYFLRMDPPSNHLIWVRRWCDRDHRHIRRSSGSCTDVRHRTFKPTISQFAARIPNSHAYIIALCVFPELLGCLLVTLLPWGDKVGLLCATWTFVFGVTGVVLVLSWVTSVTAGHTKRITTNAIILIAYCTGNSAGPLMWQAKYAPRNYVPWGIIAGCVSVCGITSLVLRWILARENGLRDKEEYDSTYDDLYVEHITPEGGSVRIKVPKVAAPPSLHTFGGQSDILSVHTGIPGSHG